MSQVILVTTHSQAPTNQSKLVAQNAPNPSRVSDTFQNPPEEPRPQDVVRARKALSGLFESDRSHFNLFLTAIGLSADEVQKAKSYAELENKIELELRICFDGIRTGKIRYVWLEGRTAPAQVEVDPHFMTALLKTSESKVHFMKDLNRYWVETVLPRELAKPVEFNESKTRERLDRMKVIIARAFPDPESVQQLDLCIAAIMARQVSAEWPIDDQLPYLFRVVDDKAVTLQIFKACMATETILQKMRRQRDGAPTKAGTEASKNFTKVLTLLNFQRIKNSSAFKNISYEHGMLFQMAVLEGKISFDWLDGKQYPVGYTIDGELSQSLKQNQKDALVKIIKILIPDIEKKAKQPF